MHWLFVTVTFGGTEQLSWWWWWYLEFHSLPGNKWKVNGFDFIEFRLNILYACMTRRNSWLVPYVINQALNVRTSNVNMLFCKYAEYFSLNEMKDKPNLIDSKAISFDSILKLRKKFKIFYSTQVCSSFGNKMRTTFKYKESFWSWLLHD